MGTRSADCMASFVLKSDLESKEDVYINVTAQVRQTCGATKLQMPLSLMWGTGLQWPPRCLPSLAADGYATFSLSQLMGFNLRICFDSGLFIAFHRSQSCCKPNQKSADIPITRDNLNAVSGVTRRRPLMISLRRGYEIPNRRATSVWVSLRGLINSSKSISPG